MSTAEPSPPVGDRRQPASRNRIVGRPDAPSLETETFGNPRQTQEIRAVTVERELTRQVPNVESAAVISRYGRESGETAVVLEPLTSEPTT
jgi:hypothetical protein